MIQHLQNILLIEHRMDLGVQSTLGLFSKRILSWKDFETNLHLHISEPVMGTVVLLVFSDSLKLSSYCPHAMHLASFY